MALLHLNSFDSFYVQCEKCSSQLKPLDWAITGIHNVAYADCNKCHRTYYKQLPVNAGLFYPVIIDAKTGERTDTLPYTNWYTKGFQAAFKNKTKKPVNIQIKKNRELKREKVAILNTIDHCYGHSLFELFNASYYLKQNEIDLIILVQKNLEWLVPDGAAEVWVADLSFSEAEGWHDSITDQIKSFTKDIHNLYICRSFVQTDETDFNIEDYSGVKPFPLHEWNTRLKTPTVTFIWRSDRFWKSFLPRTINNSISKKIVPGILNKSNRYLQYKWVIRFAEELRKQIPALDFAVAGMDSDLDTKFPAWIKDYRFVKHTDEDAINACKRYADSHLVLGCNGSSLLLPSCHAGAVINIVPMQQWAASAGSFSFRPTSFGDIQFRYQLMPAEISINSLVHLAISILRDRSLVELHTSSPWRDHEADMPSEAWADFRLNSFEVSSYFNNSKGLVTTSRN